MRSRPLAGLAGLLLVAGMALATAGPATASSDTLVSVGSPTSPFSQNKQNEPAVAIDPAHPNVVVAGSNDNIDLEPCNVGDDTTCPFTPGVGLSGVYFSFDGGGSWTQPAYRGLTARDCVGVAGSSTDACAPHVGTIGTLPLYYENGMSSGGDPAIAFGPVPDSNGDFSWSNGSRLYYANLSANLPGSSAFKGYEAVSVSRTDHVAAAAGGNESAWMDPVIVTKQSATTFSDKEQLWADNSSSSPFFGHVYACIASFRSLSGGLASPQPLLAATSTNGGDTWTLRQVTSASNTPFNPEQGFGRSGCTIRTDSSGVVYIVANQFAVGTPGHGAHIMIRSFDGGASWTRPVKLFSAIDTCFYVDTVIGRCMMDGIAGARDDLSSSPSIDIANGAPAGTGATDVIYDTWVDGRTGDPGPPVDNTTQLRLAYSTNSGATWTPTVIPVAAGDRPYYSAVALSPDGTDAYLVYDAFTTPFRDDTTSPRGLVGVVLHADVGPGGVPGTWHEVSRGVVGDPRASSQNNLQAEFLGDYVYAAATNDYGTAVWNDVRNGADCPAMDAWRMALRTGDTSVAKPAPQQDCPATFGNTDIYGGSWADPTP
jgi:hypothetical protein